MKLSISHIDGKRNGTTRTLETSSVVTLGRNPDNNFFLDTEEDRRVSGHHARLHLENGQLRIQDLNSTNGTFVNEKKVDSSILVSGDKIRFSDDGPLLQIKWEQAPSSSTSFSSSSSPSSEKVYGQRTVGMMIQSALRNAGIAPKTGTNKSTAYFEALLEDKLRLKSTRYKIIAAIALVMIIVLIGGATVYLYKNRTLNVYQVSETNAGGAIAAANRYNVFMMAGIPKKGGSYRGFCTAFAISPNILATNAHCIHKAAEDYSSIQVLMNSAPNNRYTVTKMIPHGGYKNEDISPDVGLLRIQGTLSNWATMATGDELQQLSAGIPMFLFGFPGRLNNEDAPVATFNRGEIGRITTFSLNIGEYGNNTLLQHSAFCSSGTSGSPIFNAAGKAIGINAGGYAESGKALTGYNYAMRIDLINPLVLEIGGY